uniref:HARE-HTH domain-containing protein n=1 Tax=Steinernema glaseri TaxID=37863 RepID=A0A1I8ADJ8_9BILA
MILEKLERLGYRETSADGQVRSLKRKSGPTVPVEEKECAEPGQREEGLRAAPEGSGEEAKGDASGGGRLQRLLCLNLFPFQEHKSKQPRGERESCGRGERRGTRRAAALGGRRKVTGDRHFCARPGKGDNLFAAGPYSILLQCLNVQQEAKVDRVAKTMSLPCGTSGLSERTVGVVGAPSEEANAYECPRNYQEVELYS